MKERTTHQILQEESIYEEWKYKRCHQSSTEPLEMPPLMEWSDGDLSSPEKPDNKEAYMTRTEIDLAECTADRSIRYCMAERG